MRAISIPFRIDGYGRVASTSDLRKIYADRVRMVVATHTQERVMRPAYGAGVADSLFEAMDGVPELLAADISAAFDRYLPYLTLDDVLLNYEREDQGLVGVDVVYRIPDVISDPLTESIAYRTD